MKLARIALLAVVLVAPQARATTEVAVTGSARFGASSCFELHGASSGSLARSRWLAAYWLEGSTPNAAGACLETDSHADVVITCAVAPVARPREPVQTLYAAGTAERKTYLMKVVDGALYASDAVGVEQRTPEPGVPLCGAADVRAVPVTAGGFAVLADCTDCGP